MQQLNVVTARFNPIRWRTPEDHCADWITHVLDSGAKLTLVEVAYGKHPFRYAEVRHINHVGLRADSWGWSKECALNAGIQRIPDAEYVAWGDADVWHRDANWAREAVAYLQHYRVIQTWTQLLDFGPGGKAVNAVHRSFADCYHKGEPLTGPKGTWKFDGGCYDYPHSGMFWACKREFLDWTGGLFELGGMGSGDHHMALGMVGLEDRSIPGGMGDVYSQHVKRWSNRARSYLNGRMAAVPGIIEHRFHGSKQRRGYIDRWGLFLKHGFNPDTDLKRNSFGVLEWAGNKPELEREWDLYLRSRREDDNCE